MSGRGARFRGLAIGHDPASPPRVEGGFELVLVRAMR